MNVLRRLRVRLALVFLIVGLLPLVTLGWVSLRMAENYLRRMACERDQTLLNAVTHGIEWFVRARLDQLRHLALQPAVQSGEPQRADQTLREAVARFSFFEGLFLLDASGSLVARSGSLARALHSRPHDEARFLRPFVEPLPVEDRRESGIPHPDPEWRDRVLLLRVPVQNFLRADQTVGTLVAAAALEGSELQEVLEAFHPGNREYLCILSQNGEILTRTGNGLAESAVRFLLGSLASSSISADQVQTIEYLHQGRLDLLSLRFSPVIGGWLVSGRPAADALQLLAQLRETWGVVLLLTLVLSLAAVLFLAWIVAQPLLALSHGLQELREGRYGHRVHIDSEDEIGMAARALNELADFLQRRYLIGSVWQKFRDTSSTAAPASPAALDAAAPPDRPESPS